MTSKRTKGCERLSGAGYTRQRCERDEQNKIGAAALQRFLVPVQLPPQHTGQEHAFPDPPSDDNERVEDEIPAIVDLDPSAIVPEDESDVEPLINEKLFQDVGT